jgi:hypothetical protein
MQLKTLSNKLGDEPIKRFGKFLSIRKVKGLQWYGIWFLFFRTTKFAFGGMFRIAEDGKWTKNDKPYPFYANTLFHKLTFKKWQIGMQKVK